MDDNDKKKLDNGAQATDKQAAIELIRKKVEAAYGHEPSLEAEVKSAGSVDKPKRLSHHQRYAQSLMQSGDSLAAIHEAWHKYYESLSDEEKHQVWQDFYESHGRADHYKAYIEAGSEASIKPQSVLRSHRKLARTLKPRQMRKAPKRQPKPVHSLMVGLGAGVVAVLILLFGFFNERFIAPFIQPSRAITNTPLINEGQLVGSDPEIIIPKINVEIPVVYGLTSISESAIQTALENGVVHYADTAQPGQNGNSVIVGHSSNNIFNKGKYKFAFVLLGRLDIGDIFYLQKDGKRYTYQVYEKKIVKPDDVSVLAGRDKPATATLITCDPPGTSLSRLVVVAEQISPNPSGNQAAPATTQLAAQTKTIPGNAPSLWSRLWSWIAR